MKNQLDRTLHILVVGRVQGVGFRAFTQKTAISLGIRGWVRNLEDGRVEIMASSEANKMDNFLAQIKKGPLFSKVHQVDIKEAIRAVKNLGFEVLRD